MGSYSIYQVEYSRNQLFKVGGEMDRVFNAVCPAHHRQKTFGGWRLSGGPGAWVWEPPRVPPTDWERSPP